MAEPMHSQLLVWLDTHIGRLLPEYNRDAILPPEAKDLAIEVKLAVEAHLMRCAFCRAQLNEDARLSFETMLILSGRFIAIEDLEVLVMSHKEGSDGKPQ